MGPYIVAAGLLLGVAHGLEPDHLASISLSKRGALGGLYFGLGHGLGFLAVALPLVFLLRSIPYGAAIDEAALVASVCVASVAAYAALRGIDLELGPRESQGLGAAQGALALTPTKVLLVALAASSSIYLGAAALAAFTAGSVAVMSLYGRARLAVPRNLDRALTLAVSLASIAYAVLAMAYLNAI